MNQALDENMYSSLMETLAYFSSVKAQEKYMIHGTPEEYITPDDLVEDFITEFEFFHNLDFPQRQQQFENNLNHNVQAVLQDLYSHLKGNELDLEKYSFETLNKLIHNDPAWAKARELALKTIELSQLINWGQSTVIANIRKNIL